MFREYFARRFLTLAIIVLSASHALAIDTHFMLGVSQGADEALPVMEELGIEWGRCAIMLSEIMPELDELPPTLEEALADPTLADDFIESADWSGPDRAVRNRLERGITPVVSVGHGWHSAYAKWRGEPATPDALGKDRYLGLMYIYTRAAVERYDGDGVMDADGIVIKLWQTENELNQAALTAAWGWRKPEWLAGLYSAWSDWRFVTRLMETLYRAAHDADPAARTLMNFHTDIHPRLNRLLLQPDWMAAVSEWQDYMDAIGFDAYPNYYSADPIRWEVVGERVETIKRLAPGKPVVIVEIDYPHGPAVRGFTPDKQAEFLRKSYDAARAAGAAGYFKFRVVDPEKPYAVDLTEEDLANLERIVPWYEDGKAGRLLLWALPRSAYVRDHFLDVLKSVEGNWGVIDRDGNKLPAYFVLREMVEELEPAER